MNLHLLDWLLPDPDEFDTFDDTFTADREWDDVGLDILRGNDPEPENDDRAPAD